MDILISGASTGIGRACAVHLARKGHNVWAGVRTQKAVDEIARLNVQGLSPIFLDVTDSKSIASAVSVVKKKSGTLHALINNAGIAVGGPIEGLSLDKWRRQFDINFFGLIELTQACLPMLRESKGRVLNMSSLSGRIATPFLGPYAASKFALEAFSDSLRREMRRFDVKVCIIEPGPIKTPIWEKSVGESLNTEISPDIKSLYGESIDKFVSFMRKTGETAVPVSVVVKAVEHALTARSPQTRYPVGRGIKIAARAANVIPDKWLDRLLQGRI
jgi:NAD(P)-dependent dehydrogenase (short-subunit alcohol dehydrogenase family)